jgi:NAD(P)-dependent dehydrogenase (short-subunit alcohol dehydrogenase family)
MSTTTTLFLIQREPELLGQTLVVIGASAGIGLETARRASVEGASVILTGRSAEPPACRRRTQRAEHFGLRLNGSRFPRTSIWLIPFSVRQVSAMCRYSAPANTRCGCG